jgi:hypothetical protein
LVQTRDYRIEIRGEGLALGTEQRKGRRTSSRYRTEIRGEGLTPGTEQR